MKRLCKLCDEDVVEVPKDIIIEILYRLPSKSVARFKCVSKCWRSYLPQTNLIGFFYQPRVTHFRPQIRFFPSSTNKFSSRLVLNISSNTSLHELSCSDSPEMLPGPCPVHTTFGGSDTQSLVFLKSPNNIINYRRVYIVASSNGLLFCSSQRVNKQRIYYVYSPVTRRCLALPKTKICIRNPAVGFVCKVHDHEKDVISFTIVRYSLPSLWGLHFTSITIESFSSETNVWTTNFLNLDVPLGLCPSLHWKTSSAGVIDGVFCWLDQQPQITVYDSVCKCLWVLALPLEIVAGQSCFLGISGGELYLVLNGKFGAANTVTVWYLESDIRSRDAVWVRKYVANIVTRLVQCPKANFGLPSSHLIVVQDMIIHPAVPHIFYLVVRGKVFSYDLETDIAEFVCDFGEPIWKTRHCTLFSYEWYQWPHLQWPHLL